MSRYQQSPQDTSLRHALIVGGTVFFILLSTLAYYFFVMGGEPAPLKRPEISRAFTVGLRESAR